SSLRMLAAHLPRVVCRGAYPSSPPPVLVSDPESGEGDVSPGGHLVTTAVACAAVQASTGSAALTAGVAAGGFLIDVDHVLDYLAFERQRDLRPAAFLRYYLAGQTRVVVLLLPSYEVLSALALAAWWTNLEGLWVYVLGAAALHLPLDIVFNGKGAGRNMVPVYM